MRMLKDNRGVSLTELIIAMSIIVILSVTSLMSVAVLTGAKVNRVCEDTVALMGVSLGGRQLPQNQGNQGEAFHQIYTEHCGSGFLTLLWQSV